MTNKIQNQEDEQCKHESTICDDQGTSICIDCGTEVETRIDYGKEWRTHVSVGGSRGADPSRVQRRKVAERSIFKDVESMRLPGNIINMANELYSMVASDNKIFRGKSRKSIIFACVYTALKNTGVDPDMPNLLERFEIDNKNGQTGLKKLAIASAKNNKRIVKQTTPADYTRSIMKKFRAKKEQITETMLIHDSILNKSSMLNRAQPTSVGAGIVYYWLQYKNNPMTMEEFVKQVGLSKITIKKMFDEITRVIDKKGGITFPKEISV